MATLGLVLPHPRSARPPSIRPPQPGFPTDSIQRAASPGIGLQETPTQASRNERSHRCPEHKCRWQHALRRAVGGAVNARVTSRADEEPLILFSMSCLLYTSDAADE